MLSKTQEIYFSTKDITALVSDRRSKDTKYFNLLEQYYKAFLGKGILSLPSLDQESSNQIFSIVQSLASYIQSVEIQDIFNPPDLPNPSSLSREVALKLETAASDFWFENQRFFDLQVWARTSLIKGDFYGFIRLDPKADYPFKYDKLDPSEIVLASDTIMDLQDQPWIARVFDTSIANLKRYVKNHFSSEEKVKEIYTKLALLEPEQTVTLYDFWSKIGRGQNSLVTSNGVEIYSRVWPYEHLDRYPFFQFRDIPILKKARSISTVSMLVALQERFGKEMNQIRENAEYVGNPPIVVDVESGVDINKIEGRPRLIVRKYKEGDFRIERVPSLPAYVQSLPRETYQQMLKNAGWNELMMQARVGGGQREKGALAILLRSGYVQLNPKLKNLKKAIDDANEIFKGLLKEYSLVISQSLEKKVGKFYMSFSPQDWQGIYRANCKISGLELEKERMDKNEVFVARKLGLLSVRKSLELLGVKDVDAIIRELEEEEKRRLKFEALKANFIRSLQAGFTSTQAPGVTGKEEKQSKEFSELYPSYTNFMGRILMPAFRTHFRKLRFKGKVKIVEPDESKAVADTIKIFAPLEEDKFKIAEIFSDIADRIEFVKIDEQKTDSSKDSEKYDKAKKIENKDEKKLEKIEEDESDSETKSDIKIAKWDLEALVNKMKEGVLKSKILKGDVKSFQGMPGIYLVEPHAEMIWTGQKKLIVKSRPYINEVNREFILLGDKAYGIIRLSDVRRISDKLFKKLRKYHRITPLERKRWWGKKDLYAFPFVFKKFQRPLSYEKPQGLQVFLKSTKLIPLEEELKGPQAKTITGGLKPVKIKPFSPVPPAKPEKRAFTTNEVYSVKRLKEILPSGHEWDVSEKLDGIRCFVHVKDGQVKFMSDEAKEIPLSRIEPLVREIKKKFKFDCVLDGELMLFSNGKNLKHQGIAGYVHGKFKPTEEELKGLRYKCWDILYIKGRDIAKQPFAKRSKVLDLFLRYSPRATGQVLRVKHFVGKIDELPDLIKKAMSEEGVVVRAMDAGYFATHLMFKVKKTYDIDVKVIAKETTKSGAWVYHCVLRDGTYIGQTYGQKYLDAKPGDIIRVVVEHLTLRKNGALTWFGPKPLNLKAKYLKGAPKKGESLIQLGIKEPDTLAQLKEVYLSQGGTKEEWDKWYVKHKEWKKTEMPKILKKIIGNKENERSS